MKKQEFLSFQRIKTGISLADEPLARQFAYLMFIKSQLLLERFIFSFELHSIDFDNIFEVCKVLKSQGFIFDFDFKIGFVTFDFPKSQFNQEY